MERSTSGGSVPGTGLDPSRDLRRVSDAEWLQVSLQWIDSVKSTFGMVAAGAIDDPHVRRAAVELAELGTPLMMALDRHGVDSRSLWQFGCSLRAFASSGRGEPLEAARKLAIEASSSVMSLVNRLSIATDPLRTESRAPPTWKSLDSSRRRALILQVAGEGVKGGIKGVSGEVAIRTQAKGETIRRWIYDHRDLVTQLAGIDREQARRSAKRARG